MGTTTRLVLVTTVLALVMAGCSSEDVDPGAVPSVDEASEEAQAEAEEAVSELRTEAEEAVDQLRTEQAPEIKQELLDRCQEALESLREADSEATATVEDICNRIEGTDVSDMDVWSEIQQEINDLQMN